MMSIVLVIVYMLSGEIHVEQKAYKDEATCVKEGKARIEQLENNPDFDGGLFGACVRAKVTAI